MGGADTDKHSHRNSHSTWHNELPGTIKEKNRGKVPGSFLAIMCILEHYLLCFVLGTNDVYAVLFLIGTNTTNGVVLGIRIVGIKLINTCS